MLPPDESAIFPDSVAATVCARAARGIAAKAIIAKHSRGHRKYRDFANFTTHPHKVCSLTRSEEKLTGDCDLTVTRDAKHALTRNPFISLASAKGRMER
jgi:hypothetical protein